MQNCLWRSGWPLIFAGFNDFGYELVKKTLAATSTSSKVCRQVDLIRKPKLQWIMKPPTGASHSKGRAWMCSIFTFKDVWSGKMWRIKGTYKRVIGSHVWLFSPLPYYSLNISRQSALYSTKVKVVTILFVLLRIRCRYNKLNGYRLDMR